MKTDVFEDIRNSDYGEIVEIMVLKKGKCCQKRWYKMTRYSKGWIKLEFGDNYRHHVIGYHHNGKSIQRCKREKIWKGYKVSYHRIVKDI